MNRKRHNPEQIIRKLRTAGPSQGRLIEEKRSRSSPATEKQTDGFQVFSNSIGLGQR